LFKQFAQRNYHGTLCRAFNPKCSCILPAGTNFGEQIALHQVQGGYYVKGFAKQEEQVLTRVTEARAEVGQMQLPKDVLTNEQAFKQFQANQDELGSAIARLLVVVEQYPVLKSDQNFLALQSQLEGTENRIAVERMRFIESVQDYNTRIRRMPTSIVASLGGFKQKANFTAAAGAEKVPEVKF